MRKAMFLWLRIRVYFPCRSYAANVEGSSQQLWPFPTRGCAQQCDYEGFGAKSFVESSSEDFPLVTSPGRKQNALVN